MNNFSETEYWKAWPQNSKYLISSHGRIKGINGRIMKTRINRYGYSIVCLRLQKNNPHTYQVHRLVAETFLSNYDETLYVDHINGIRADNRVENLQMVDKFTNEYLKRKNHKKINKIISDLIAIKGYEETEKLLLKLKEDNL